MSETTPPVTPPSPSTSPEPPRPVPEAAPAAALAQPVNRSGLWVGLLALIVAGLAIGASALVWQKVSLTQQELARRSQDTSSEVVQARTLASQAEALTQELQARLAVAEVRLSEVSLQRSQLEELMLTLSRSRDDNLVQDMESALRLAQQQAQLTGSAQPLVSALQAADQRIGRAAQPRLNPVQRAIARDLERIQNASLADIPSLVQRLDELTRQVDQWPVLNQMRPIPPRATRPLAESGAVAETVGLDATEDTAATAGAGTVDELSLGWARVSSWWESWWTRAWADVTQKGREMVRVSRIDRPEAALLAPEQAFFLRENLKLQLLNARMGLLARQFASARSDLVTIESTVGRYFDASAPQLAGVQAALRQLSTDLVGNELPRPDETLAALAVAAGGR